MLRLIITTTRIGPDTHEVDEDSDFGNLTAFDVMDVLRSYAHDVLVGSYTAFTATIGKPEGEVKA